MPKNAIDYSKSVIYKICCRDVSVKEEYVGSTTHITDRRKSHKSCCHNEEDKFFNLPVYVFIRANGGWLNWELVIVEEFPCTSSEQQRTRERFWMESLGANLNSRNPIRTPADQALQCRKYNETHREEISEHKKKYRAANAEAIQENQKKYAAANAEAIREQKKKYYAANLDKIQMQRSVPVQCECGDKVCHNHLARHKRSAKHIKAMEAI